MTIAGEGIASMPPDTAESDKSAAPAPPPQFALWSVGFRPFFLFAGVYAVIAIATWVAQYGGWLGGYASRMAGPLWHAHEMIFGYTLAVLVGFLFTAVHNWTGQPTPSGLPLAALVMVWLAARILVATPWHALAAAFDTAFAAAAALAIARPLLRGRSRRNYFFVAVVLALGAANLAFYLAMAGVLHFSAERDLQVGLDVILFVITVMGGRIIPMFTANALKQASPRRVAWIEHAALGSVLAIALADLADLPAIAIAAIAGVAAIAHAARLVLWQPWLTATRPILWILHASYAWIVVYLALRALLPLAGMPASLATHALTVGAIGGLTIGMMTRTARGHTGRPLRSGRMETAAFILLQLAAVTRVFVPLASPQFYVAAIMVSGALWSLAFGLFVAKFWPILARPRSGGRVS